MRGNRGFTLIELLAVLVILAIIALITTPIILDVIDDSRQKGAEDKAWGVIDAMKLAFTEDQTGDNPQYGVDGADRTVTFGGTPMVGSAEVKASGQMPESGTGQITEDGIITVTDLKFDQYYCSTNSNSTVMCCVKQAGQQCK